MVNRFHTSLLQTLTTNRNHCRGCPEHLAGPHGQHRSHLDFCVLAAQNIKMKFKKLYVQNPQKT